MPGVRVTDGCELPDVGLGPELQKNSKVPLPLSSLSSTEECFLKFLEGSRHLTQLVECWCTIHEAFGSCPALHTLGVVVHAYNSSTWEVEAGREFAENMHG